MATKRKRRRRREDQLAPFEAPQAVVTGDQVRPRKLEQRAEEVRNRFIRS